MTRSRSAGPAGQPPTALKTRTSSPPTKPSPIEDEEVPEGTEVDDPFADFAGTPMPALVECYLASNTIEAKFIADQLMEQGIPAIADKIDINLTMGGLRPEMWGYGPEGPRPAG